MKRVNAGESGRTKRLIEEQRTESEDSGSDMDKCAATKTTNYTEKQTSMNRKRMQER